MDIYKREWWINIFTDVPLTPRPSTRSLKTYVNTLTKIEFMSFLVCQSLCRLQISNTILDINDNCVLKHGDKGRHKNNINK